MTWLLPNTWIEGSSLPSLSIVHQTQRLIFCICVTVIVSPILQDVQCSRCYLVGTSGASNICCTQEGVGSTCCWDLRLYQCFNPATALQPNTQCPQSGHLYVQAAKHHNKLVWPLPLDLLGNGVQRLVKCYYWRLPSIKMLNSFSYYVHWVFDHCYRVVLETIRRFFAAQFFACKPEYPVLPKFWPTAGGHFEKWLTLPTGCEFSMAQYPLLFPRYLSTHLPNLVRVSQNEQLVWYVELCRPTIHHSSKICYALLGIRAVRVRGVQWMCIIKYNITCPHPPMRATVPPDQCNISVRWHAVGRFIEPHRVYYEIFW